MKKSLLLLLATCALSTVSSATVLVDSCNLFIALGSSGGPSNISGCNGAPAGSTITAVHLDYNVDILIDRDFNGTPTATVTINTPGMTILPFIIDINNRPFAGTADATSLFAAYLANPTFFTPPPNISWTGNGGIAGIAANLNFTITYDDAPPPSGVPEPSTFMLLGTALTGLGVAARRRKA